MLSDAELKNKLVLLLDSLRGIDLDELEKLLLLDGALSKLDLSLRARLSDADAIALLHLLDDLKLSLPLLSGSRSALLTEA